MKKQPLLLSILFLFIFSSAQSSSKLDSLFTILKTAKEDTTKVRVLYNIAKNYRYTAPDSSIYFGKQALSLNAKLDNITNGILLTNVYLAIGVGYKELSNDNQSLNYYLQALEVAEKSKDSRMTGMALFHIGSHYDYTEQYTLAISYIDKALRIFESINDSLRIIETVVESGIINKSLGNFEQAEKYFNTGYDYAKRNNKVLLKSICLGQLGLLRSKQGRHQEAIQILIENRENLEQTNALSDYYWMSGNEYLALKDYQRALDNYLEGLPIAIEDSLPNIIADYYDMMSEAYAGIKNFDKAYNYARQSMLMKDTIYDVEKQDQLIEMQAQFESNKKDKEITLLNKDKQLKEEEASHQKLIKNIFIASLAIVLMFLFLLLNRYNIKKRTTQQLEEKNKLIEKEKNRAEQSEKFKSQFLANMSHEIRTPMNAVIGMSNLMEDTRLDEKQRRYLNAIKSSSENLLVIINDVLDLSKLEAGRMELEKIPFKLDDVLNTVYFTLRYKAEEKGLHFNISKEGSVANYLLGDPSRLVQVLLNLSGNAIKFTEKGSVSIAVIASALRTKQSVAVGEIASSLAMTFRVSDTGVGIPKEKLSTIFEAFKQASEGTSRKYGGTGLGLSISQQIIQLHRSHIEVESEQGKGSVFSFTLNYETTTEQEFEKVNYKHEAENFDFLKGTKILLAEDNVYNQEVAVQSLIRWVSDLKIDIAEDGNQVLELLAKNNYDVILMDVQMPGMDGYDATKRIRKEFGVDKKNIPIIALTASATREEINAGFDAGMNAYVAKPFKPSELLNKIAEQLNKVKPSTAKAEQQKTNTSSSLIDLSLLKEITNDDKDQMKIFIKRFLNEAPITFQIIDKNLELKNYSEIKKQLHILRPQLEMMGIKYLAKLIQETENSIGQTTQHAILVSQLKIVIEICLNAMEQLKKEIS